MDPSKNLFGSVLFFAVAGAIFVVSVSDLYLLGAIIGGVLGGGVGLLVASETFEFLSVAVLAVITMEIENWLRIWKFVLLDMPRALILAALTLKGTERKEYLEVFLMAYSRALKQRKMATTVALKKMKKRK